jgi:hypothetical protein
VLCITLLLACDFFWYKENVGEIILTVGKESNSAKIDKTEYYKKYQDLLDAFLMDEITQTLKYSFKGVERINVVLNNIKTLGDYARLDITFWYFSDFKQRIGSGTELEYILHRTNSKWKLKKVKGLIIYN